MSIRTGARVRASKVGKNIKLIGEGMLVYIKGNRWKIYFTPEKVTPSDSVSETAMSHVVIELQESVTVSDSMTFSDYTYGEFDFNEGTTVGDEISFESYTYLLMDDGEIVEVSDSLAVSISDKSGFDLGIEGSTSDDSVEYTTASLETYRLSESVVASDSLTDNTMLLEVVNFDESAYVNEEPIFEGPDPSGQYIMRTAHLYSRAYVQDGVLVIPAYALNEEVGGQDSAYMLAITITDLDLGDETTVSDEVGYNIFTDLPWLEESVIGVYWTYRKRIPISGSPDGEMTDYPISLNAMYGPGTDSGSTVYLDGCNSDFSDLRFTSMDGQTQLGFGIESKTDGSTAKVWVKVPDIPVSGTYIYVYFGNANATSVADMWNAFLVYEHFLGSDLDMDHWELVKFTSIAKTVADSKLTVTSVTPSEEGLARSGLKAMKDGVTVKPPARCLLAEMAIEWSSNNAQRGQIGIMVGDGVNSPAASTDVICFTDAWTGAVGSKTSFINGVQSYGAKVVTTGTATIKLTRDKDGNIKTYWDGTQYSTGTNTNTPEEFLIYLCPLGTSTMSTLKTGLVYLRAWTTNEPTASTADAMEMNPDVAVVDITTVSDEYELSITESEGQWLSPWSYRKSHAINASAGAGTNYQVLMHIMYGTGTDTTETFYGTPCGKVYLNEHCKTDFSDLRFTMSDGRIVDYWIESKTDGVEAFVWVELLTDISSASATLYVYYGNADAISQSSGKDTFVYFTDFHDATGWTLGANASIVDGQLKGNGVVGETKTATDVIPAGLQFSVDMKMEFTALGNDASGGYTNGAYPLLYTSSAKTGMYWYRSGNVNVYWGIEGTLAINTACWPATVALFRHSFKVLTDKIRYEDYALDGTSKHTPFEKTGSPNQTLPRNIALFGNASQATVTAFIDYIVVRKIAATEPTHGATGTEEAA